MEPGATVNCEVTVWARCWPSEPMTPVDAAGDGDRLGGAGHERPARLVLEQRRGQHGPGAGDRRAQRRHRAVGREVGGELHRDGGPGGDVGPRRRDGGDREGGRRGGRGGGGLVDVQWSTATKPPAATTSTATHTVRITHRRGPLRLRDVLPSHGSGILPGSEQGLKSQFGPIAAMMAESRPSSVTLVPSDSRT